MYRRLYLIALLVAMLPAPAAAQQPTAPTDRLAWDQTQATESVAPQYSWVFVVDGARQAAAIPASAVVCTRVSTDAITCRTSYPPLTPGRHELRLITVRTIPDGTNPPLVVESAPSAPFVIDLIVAPPAPTGLRNERGGSE
jgi:hypothetical protein